MSDDDRLLTPAEFHAAEGVGDWRVVGQSVCGYFRTGSVARGARLAAAIGELAGIDDDYPAVDVRRDGVAVRLFGFPPAPLGLRGRHVELARQISAAAILHNVQRSPCR